MMKPATNTGSTSTIQTMLPIQDCARYYYRFIYTAFEGSYDCARGSEEVDEHRDDCNIDDVKKMMMI